MQLAGKFYVFTYFTFYNVLLLLALLCYLKWTHIIYSIKNHDINKKI